MKPAILLIGANGQVGRELTRSLPRLGPVTSLGRQQLDLSRPEEIRSMFRALCPALIINAAAYTAVDKAESEQALARAINAEAPAVMAQEAKKIGARLIHYSTDYVFDGTKTDPYDEEDPTNPQNVYGRTKLEGELAIQNSDVPYQIFRTAWVYATQGRNFLLTILRLATQREELRIVRDQFGAPTSSRAIAEATTNVLSQIREQENGSFSPANLNGIYHLTAAGKTTWFDFAEAILERARAIETSTPWLAAATNNLPLIARHIIPIHTSEYPTPARRPAYSVLSNERLARAFSVRLPDWRTQLDSLFKNSPPQ
ncbi:MAG TPA: dTDP-4-dehydrorhamnose reductase [Candidatus Acidoferrales bacterium]|nr:dTDP-4-dehydrorhamnose reductase [Candidatus Acidoferrales bacterium]